MTRVVVTTKVAEVAPAVILTLDGTEATLEFELDRVTVIPAVPAGAVRVTLPVEEVPPETEVGLSEIVLRAGTTGAGFTVRAVVLLIPE